MSEPPLPLPTSPDHSDLAGQVFDASPVAIVLSTVDGRVVRANHAMTALLGYSFQELASLTGPDISHPDDLALTSQAVREVLEGRASEGRFSKRYVTKQGQIVWADVHFALLRDASGTPTHFVTHIVDLSTQRAFERKWYTLFENAADGVFVADGDGFYQDANPAALSLLGVSLDELRCLRIVDIIDPADLVAHPLRLRDLERDGGVTTVRKIRRKDGSILHAEIAGRRLPDGTAIGIVRDVGRREREAALVGVRLQIAQLIREQNADSAVAAALRPAVQMVDSDRGALHVFDRGRKVIGQAWLPDWQSQVSPPLLPLASRPTPLELQAHVDEVQGVRRLVVPVAAQDMVSAVIQVAGKPTPYSDEDREYLSAIASAVVDAVTRHRAEQFLQATVDRLALASDAARIGVWEIDLATQQVTWDDHMYALFGVVPPRPGHEHEVWREALSEADRLAHDAKVSDAVARGADLHTDIQVRTPAGEARVLEAHARVLAGPDGQPLRLVGLNIDVTERRRDEAELRKHRDHLDELVRARTLELDRSNRELEQFAMVASHDLKAPLRTIQTLAQLLQDEQAAKLDDEGREMLGHIATAAERMQAMTDSLLAYSRLTTRAQPFEQVDLGALARQVAADLAAVAQQSGGRIEVGALPTVFGDPTQLRQLLQNLMANGLKFARAGVPPQVTVAGERLPDRWRITVDDNGIGIEPQHRDRVFRMFERLHGAHRFEGSGIGLAICQKVVERHGGQIRAESHAQPGTRMVVELPAK